MTIEFLHERRLVRYNRMQLRCSKHHNETQHTNQHIYYFDSIYEYIYM